MAQTYGFNRREGLPMLVMLSVTFLGAQVMGTYSPTVSFYLDLYPKGEFWVQFPRKMESECIFEAHKDLLMCMGHYTYSKVTTTWRTSPSDILYVKVNCRVQDYFFVHRYVCFCTNSDLSKQYGNTSFQECQLRDLKSRTFQNLQNLQVLDLSGNYIAEVEKGALSGLKNLTYLSLSGNTFTTLPDGILCNLPYIRFVHLSSTGIRTLPKLFSGCSTVAENPLEYLFMSKGVVSKIPKGSLANMTNLLWLDISENQITSLSEGAFEGASTLQVLNLSSNKLQYPLPDICTTLPALERLNLHDCGFNSWDHTRFEACARLEELDLSGNQIVEVEGDFSITPQLSKLNVSRNSMHRVDPGFTLGNLSKLVNLDISRNNLAEMYGGFFSNSNSLVHLDLSHNVLSESALNLTVLLEKLENLKSLDLSHNNFSVLPSKLLPPLLSLQLLDISRNAITEIHPDCFANLDSPSTLRLVGNYLKSIQNGTFSSMSVLKVLDLSENEISEVDMAALPLSIEVAVFNDNKLYDIPSAFRLKNFTSLVGLHLSRNRLTTLDKNCFLGFTALEVLDLSWNMIKIIDNHAFSQLEQLKKLNLEGNHLVLAGPGQSRLFHGAFNLQLLNLAFNWITDFPAVFNGLKGHLLKLDELNMTGNPLGEISQPQPYDLDMTLRLLVLDNCSLSFIDAQAFFGLHKLDKVYLRHNRLSHFPPFFVNRSVEFDLRDNPVVCSCHMTWLKEDTWQEYGIQIVVAMYYVDICLNTVQERNQSVQTIEQEDFLCKTQLSCPEGCMCFASFEGAQPVVVKCENGMTTFPRFTSQIAARVYLSGNNFSALGDLKGMQPGEIYHTAKLYLNNSHVQGLQQGFFANQPVVQILYLDHNNISELPPDIFGNLVLLTELYLNDNRLSILYPSTFRPLKALRIIDLRNNAFHFIQSGVTEVWAKSGPLRSIYLSNNPWHCTCSTVSFRNWLVSYFYLVPDWRSVVCKGVSIIDHMLKTYQCRRILPKLRSDYSSKGVLIGLLLMVVFLVVTATFVFRIRKTLKALIFARFGWSFRRASWEPDKHYDAFILYNIYNRDGAAEKWVNQDLVQKLETGDKPFKVFLPDRDVTSGESIVDTSCQTIAESKRTIVVISESFATSQWCNRTFQIAYRHMLQNKKHKLILIFHGKVKVNELDPVIKVFIMMGDYLSCNSRYFWERLCYELPDPRTSEEFVNENEAGVSETDVILQNAVASDLRALNNSSHV